MPNRLTRIYTRTGDDGSTGLANGTRLPKDSMRIETLGCLDELSCLIGLAVAYSTDHAPTELETIQNQLFEVGAELALPPEERIGAAHVAWLEQSLDARNGALPPLKEFLLPGGSLAAAHCHLARAVCRRAERRVVTLARSDKVNPSTLRYLNRLSDLLFVLARVLSRQDGSGELLWQPGARP
jgi:cob(I)alamin adenosyltransferase